MSSTLSRGSRGAIDLASGIAAAYVSNNAVPTAELPKLIASIHTALTDLGNGASAAQQPADVVETPNAGEIRKSVRPDAIVSFIDGRSYKTLKRHLSAHGLDPRSYRERYGLPADYPMVAPNYAATRSALAKAIGLGRPGAMAEREQEQSRRNAA
jgi:predicted transcriptional regulator